MNARPKNVGLGQPVRIRSSGLKIDFRGLFSQEILLLLLLLVVYTLWNRNFYFFFFRFLLRNRGLANLSIILLGNIRILYGISKGRRWQFILEKLLYTRILEKNVHKYIFN